MRLVTCFWVGKLAIYAIMVFWLIEAGVSIDSRPFWEIIFSAMAIHFLALLTVVMHHRRRWTNIYQSYNKPAQKCVEIIGNAR